MPTNLLSPPLQLFYDLVHSLNSTLDLDRVLAQVIDRVNEFLHIDATSVSLLDPESQELVIKMTVGQATDPQAGLHLPPSAGIAGWVARHGEAVVIQDAQLDDRFYPGVDQLTGFTTRGLLCVPLRIQSRTIGVIQAISGNADAFSPADLCYMITLADVAALAIENARLYTSEHRAHVQAEKLRLVSETLEASPCCEKVLTSVLGYLSEMVSCDRAAIFVCEDVASFRPISPSEPDLGLETELGLRAVAAWGFADPSAALAFCEPTRDMPLFERMVANKRPISIVDAQGDERHVQLLGAEPARSWLGVPMLTGGSVIGYISLDRNRVQEFVYQEIDSALLFTQQVARAVTNMRLLRTARDRVDELSVLTEAMMAIADSAGLDAFLDRVIGAMLAPLDLQGAGISLLDASGERLELRAQRALSPRSTRIAQCSSIAADPVCRAVIQSHRTMLLANTGEDTAEEHTVICAPILAHGAAVGLLVTESKTPECPVSRQVTLLEAIRAQIGNVVEETARPSESAAPGTMS